MTTTAAPTTIEVMELAEATILRLAPPSHAGPFSTIQGTLDVLRAAIAAARVEAEPDAPPRWDPDYWDSGSGAWRCAACGSVDLRDTEEHPTDHDIDTDASSAEVIAFEGRSECGYEAATNARVTCRDCMADMSYPDGVEVTYG